jgi:hypothetical protein
MLFFGEDFQGNGECGGIDGEFFCPVGFHSDATACEAVDHE